MGARWSEEEAQYLFDNCGIISNKKIAVRLERSYHAVRQKLHKSGVSVFDNFYSARMLGKELGRSHKTIMKWHRLGYLRGERAEWGRGYLESPMVFLEQDIVQFLNEHKALFRNSGIVHPYFKNIVEAVNG